MPGRPVTAAVFVRPVANRFGRTPRSVHQAFIGTELIGRGELFVVPDERAGPSHPDAGHLVLETPVLLQNPPAKGPAPVGDVAPTGTPDPGEGVPGGSHHDDPATALLSSRPPRECHLHATLRGLSPGPNTEGASQQ